MTGPNHPLQRTRRKRRAGELEITGRRRLTQTMSRLGFLALALGVAGVATPFVSRFLGGLAQYFLCCMRCTSCSWAFHGSER